VSEPYVGQVIIFGFNYAPRNYAFCNGQLVAISQNEALFSILGTTYGGDGRSTFGLPNFQEHAVMNIGHGANLSSYVLGQTSGTASVTLTQGQMPLHPHTAYGILGTATNLGPAANGWIGEKDSPDFVFSPSTTPDSTMSPSYLSLSGGSQPHPNEQPYLAMNFCIALYGIFPSRN